MTVLSPPVTGNTSHTLLARPDPLAAAHREASAGGSLPGPVTCAASADVGRSVGTLFDSVGSSSAQAGAAIMSPAIIIIAVVFVIVSNRHPCCESCRGTQEPRERTPRRCGGDSSFESSDPSSASRSAGALHPTRSCRSRSCEAVPRFGRRVTGCSPAGSSDPQRAAPAAFDHAIADGQTMPHPVNSQPAEQGAHLLSYSVASW